MNSTINVTISLSLQGSPYLRVIDRMFGRCVMSGLTKKWLRDIYSLYQRKYTEERSIKTEAAVNSNENERVSLQQNAS